MNLAIVSIFALFTTTAAFGQTAPGYSRTVEFAEGADLLNAEAQDGDTVRVLLPFVEKAEPRVELEGSLVYQGACELVGLKNEAPQVELLLKMPATLAGTGFNGCAVSIDRGFASDASDELRLEYGYTIWD